MATTRESTNYAALFTSKYPGLPKTTAGDTMKALPFSVTVVSASATDDKYYLTVIPKGATVVGLHCTTDGLGASAGAGATAEIGTATNTDLFMADTDFDASNAQGSLSQEAIGYVATADTPVLLMFDATAAVVGKKVWGAIYIVPGP